MNFYRLIRVGSAEGQLHFFPSNTYYAAVTTTSLCQLSSHSMQDIEKKVFCFPFRLEDVDPSLVCQLCQEIKRKLELLEQLGE